ITNKEEMISKHIYDSLLISKVYDFKNKTILDVGSGGGFPGIPLAMLYPTSHFVLVDSTMKKVKYLDEVTKALNLTNVEVKCARVEELKEKEKYDVVIARALSELRIYLELVTYLVKVNGNVIALKGKNANDELAASDNAIKKLNLSLNKIQAAAIPTGEKRMNLIFTKIKSTDKQYPREFSQIKKRPL
ncbi:MAG: 16S rRNA (guanine(527)-N(7))-methyltransferase RsmG, partial [Bacilli bacterium]|nr:16S rRNA (guanine(527)-N(7))-methyltransferase RsmG [Bacilli bacterium]